MKLFETFNTTGYHTAVMTSFGIDFDAFESVAVNRLRGADCRNIMLVADAGMLSMALGDEKRMPKFAGSSYLVGKAVARGVFHPKLIVQLGKDGGRLIVASANATTPGLAGNLELALELKCGKQDSGERRLIQNAWNYATSFLDPRQRASQEKLDRAYSRTPWLERNGTSAGLVQLQDGTDAAFLATDGSEDIGRRFADLVGDAKRVDRLVVMSPYWDDDLRALQDLQTTLNPKSTVLLVDIERQLFPSKAALKLSKTQVSDIAGFDKKHFPEGHRRFVHAKMIVATAGRVDHVLVGSANCSVAALGSIGRKASNEEACLYRRLPGGLIFKELGLEPLLTKDSAVDIAKMPKLLKQDPLPLEELSLNDPGAFEYAHEKLFWWSPSNKLTKEVIDGALRIELLAADGEQIETKIDFFPDGPKAYFRIGASKRLPALARFSGPKGRLTGTSIIANVDELRKQTKDALPVGARRAVRELETDAEESLWLLESILALSTPRAGLPPRPRPTKVVKGTGSDAQESRKPLDFEAFMRGRRRWTKLSHGERSWLGSSNVALVRAFLNRGLGIGTDEPPIETPVDEPDVTSVLDRGDETGGDELALDKGFDPSDPVKSLRAVEALEKRRRDANSAAIAKAVSSYTQDITGPERHLDEVDLLRLRAMLTIIAVAGWAPSDATPTERSEIQVLPRSGGTGETWPRLIGRVLAAVFLGPTPAIKKLIFDHEREVIPDDALETWACCMWSASAALSAARTDPGCKGVEPYLTSLDKSMRQWLSLNVEEVSSPPFAQVVDALDRRFSRRLAILPQRAICLSITKPSLLHSR